VVTILGPTATGKTELAARLAYEVNGEVISADSRQVYRGMSIGTGKDYDDYLVGGVKIPYHLIDIVDPGYEYNIFEYQKDFLKAYQNITNRDKIPILCGGSGMYLEAVLQGYRLAASRNDEDYLESVRDLTDDQLTGILRSYKTPHNITDFEDRQRLLKAIIVARSSDKGNQPGNTDTQTGRQQQHIFPIIDSVIIGISYPRGLIKARISKRLEYRLKNGMVEEVEHLLSGGISPERLMKYGLEYKFVTLFLLGKISGDDLYESLNIAIRQFAKRQMTWFRRMEKKGMKIHWLDGKLPMKKKVEEIRRLITHSFAGT
jgi:tRNA dimethylallyltransferase